MVWLRFPVCGQSTVLSNVDEADVAKKNDVEHHELPRAKRRLRPCRDVEPKEKRFCFFC